MQMHPQLQPYLRYRSALLAFVVLVTATVAIVAARAQPKYVTSLSIAVNRVNVQETPDYQFDGYYAIQASDLFSQTLLSWFLTPSVLVEFYDHAGLDPQMTTLHEVVSRFRARKFAAQNIVIQFTEQTEERARKLAAAITEVVQERSRSLEKSPQGTATFDVVPAQPVIVAVKPDVLLALLAAFVSSILLGVAGISILRYLSV